jgi:3-hydroxyisobutyrate dehydrogenase
MAERRTVAWLGVGRMGGLMARHVLAAGHDLVVWNRTPGRTGDLVSAGAREAASPAEAVEGADVAVLMLFGPDSVRELLPQVVRPGLLVVDSTTVGPQAARELGRLAAEAGARYVDAPVAGSVGPARDGTLGVLVGCRDEDWPEVEELVRLWGDPGRVRRVGSVGAGSALKLVVNQGIGVLAAGLGEALRLGRDLGLERSVVLDVLGSAMYGWTLQQKRPMLDADDFSGTQFSLDLLEKDLALACAAGGRDGVDLAVTRSALDHVRDALAAGHAGEDYAAVIAAVADEGSANSW